MVEWYWQGKIEVLGEKFLSVPLCPPQISNWLARNLTHLTTPTPTPTPHLWNFEGSLLWSKESITGTYQSQINPIRTIQPFYLLLILSFPIILEISETSIVISFPYLKYAWILIDPMCATRPAYLIFLYLTTLIIWNNMKYSPVCFYFLPLGSSHSLSATGLRHSPTERLSFTLKQSSKPIYPQHSTACQCLTVLFGRFRTYPFAKS